MGWEDRNGRRYYYRKRREGSRVVSEYYGAGPFAETLSTEDQARQQDQARERRETAKRRAEVLAVDAQLDGVGDLVRRRLHAGEIDSL